MDSPAIVAENLEKHFGDVHALRGVSFEVPTGGIVGLLGPNGAGKTTAVRILTTLLKPDGGRALVGGIDVCEQPALVRASIGLAGQYAAVDENLTGRENLFLVGRLTHLPAAEIPRRADELLGRFDLADAADRTVRTYSGGMRRRLDVAAALVHRPPILFFDEPTTGLDPRSRTELWAFIEELAEAGTSLLLTTQYLEEAERLADHMVVIDRGQVIAEGTSEQLKARLGGTVAEIGFERADSISVAAGKLAPLGNVDVQGTKLFLSVDGPTALLEAVRVLDAEHLEPTSLVVREPTLDDVFLAITGHAAEEGDERDEDARKGRR